MWAKNKYTISFNANGGSGAPSSQTKTYGLDLTLSSTTPTRSGYTFKGWGTSSSSTTASYQPGGKYTSNSSATLYAVEPSCGVGNFMGLIPESMDAKMYGVELDSLSGRIARQLYQKNGITIDGYEKTHFPDSFFDVAIGNVPFNDFKLLDKKYDKYNFLSRSPMSRSSSLRLLFMMLPFPFARQRKALANTMRSTMLRTRSSTSRRV